MKKMQIDGPVTTRSEGETRMVGIRTGKRLSGRGVVGLTGDLGSGKTVLASGIFHGAGLPQGISVTSPTFTLVNVYPGPCEMYHVDLYRLDSPAEAVHAGLTELWESGDESIVVIEWFEKFPEIWPDTFLKIEIEIVGTKDRKLKFSNKGLRKNKFPV